MPLHEFVCGACGGRPFTLLVGVVADAPAPKCPKCGGMELHRKVSRFSRVRSTDAAIDDLADAADSLDETDPRAVRRFLKDMSSEMDDEIEADELEELLETSGDDDPVAESEE